MPTGMGVASPKFSKGDRRPKKTKHCTILMLRKTEAKEFHNKGTCLNKVQVEIKMHKKISKK